MSFNPIASTIALVLAAIGALALAAEQIAVGIVFFILAGAVVTALKMARQWERAVVLRAGKFTGVKGPGLFAIVPILDNVTTIVDTRVRTTQFVAEQTLTRDTVPVDVDAIIFWIVNDVRRAALEVADYGQAIAWAAQTSLREMIGASDLATLLSNRAAADEELRKTIDAKSEPWGITVNSVEIRDIKIPTELQNAMSREAQAERERHARVILGSAEAEVARKFVDAAETYANNPVALHLRGMNMLYESVKERGTTIIVPASAVDSMNLGGIAGLTALAAAGGANPPGGARQA
jgi:regulator of protease activity HflC (stomatin/prohibitin superfamily)